jgi:HK97 gp10 family phage protein
MISLKIRDPDNLDQKLQQVEPKLSRNILRTAVRAGGNIVRDAARDRVNSRSGLLRRDIKTHVRRGRVGQTIASVGVMSRGKKQEAFYALFVEKGHRIRTRSGADMGMVKPYPFLLPALAAKQSEVHRTVMEHIARRLGELV